MIKILFVCHGNICRSPMAEFVMKDMVNQKGAAGFEIASAATSTEEIGNPVYPPARRKLAEHGIGTKDNELGVGVKRARRMTLTDYYYYDHIVCMDRYNIKNALRITGGNPDGKISLLLDHAPADYSRGRADVADPWYTGDFGATWDDVQAGCAGLLEECLKR